MRLARVLGGLAVGGIVTVAGIAPAAAGDLLAAGTNYNDTSQVDVIELDDPAAKLVDLTLRDGVNQPIATVQVGGTAQTSGFSGGLGQVLAQPLPLKVCVLCAPKYVDVAR